MKYKDRTVSVMTIILPSDRTNQCTQNVDMANKSARFFLCSKYNLYVINLNRHGRRREGPALLDFWEKSKLKKEEDIPVIFLYQ
jgi:hypothetical protein